MADLSSPSVQDPHNHKLRRGDLVRVSELGARSEKRLHDRNDALGRVCAIDSETGEFSVEWIVLGGMTHRIPREYLTYTTAQSEGMTDDALGRRKRRPPPIEPLLVTAKRPAKTPTTTTRKKAAPKKKKDQPSAPTDNEHPKHKNDLAKIDSADLTKAGNKRKLNESISEPTSPTEVAESKALYEKQRREFDRVVSRLEKIDKFGWFWDDAPDEFDEHYESRNNDEVAFPNNPPFNWEMIRRRRLGNRYVLNREVQEEEERFARLGPYYQWRGKWPKRRFVVSSQGKKHKKRKPNKRVLNPFGVNWKLFAQDVNAMLDATVKRHSEIMRLDENDKAGVLCAARRVREAVMSAVSKTGRRHERELQNSDNFFKFSLAIDRTINQEPAMQSNWRTQPFPERKYERLVADRVCAGLSTLDERIASHELLTSLPNSFIGVPYRYDDTGQSEAWMKSVLDEAELKATIKDKRKREEQQAALELAGLEGVTRAQVTATMNAILMGVEDKVMTEQGVLLQPQLKSVNWLIDHTMGQDASVVGGNDVAMLQPEIVEQPVWGIDCYTRRNVAICLETEFDPETAIAFIEKWLLPAINACPPEIAHDMSNAARLIEGLPFDCDQKAVDDEDELESKQPKPASVEEWSHTLLGNALIKKIETSAPPWVVPAAYTLRQAVQALGNNFFRLHPKGHGSVLLCEKVKTNTLITFYRGEIYPLWRWCEKMDAIEMTQLRKSLKPALPDFYNMTMERPQADPRGYGTLIVDASRKAGYGSSLSHSCDPTCEVRVAALNGELCLAMTTLRELEIGEELTFNYNASTDSLQEYRSAVCLCGHANCRGSFLHFATADCFQQVLNRNAPIASRFANLVKGSTKQVLSEEDDKILKNHGFCTAAFGATAVNRRESRPTKYGVSLSDTLDIVPVWLKTYVADVLRYIEYERRALPIALICDRAMKGKGLDEPRQDGEELVLPENGFSFFVRNQADILLDLVKKETNDLSEANVANETRRLGATLWRALSSEKKQRWQDAARADFERRKKEVKSAPLEKPSKKSKKESEARKKLDDDDMAWLISSEFEFQDADADGIAAMGQRVQQLTATLSRVGRVLDRHREGLIMITQNVDTEDLEALRDAIHPPLSVIPDEEVVDWMWNSSDGVFFPLLRRVEVSQCVRPSLILGIQEIRERYSRLNYIGSCSPSSVLSNGCSARQFLNEALLELRNLILSELSAMARTFRQRVKPTKGKGGSEQRADSVKKEIEESEDDDSRAHTDDNPRNQYISIGGKLREKDSMEELESKEQTGYNENNSQIRQTSLEGDALQDVKALEKKRTPEEAPHPGTVNQSEAKTRLLANTTESKTDSMSLLLYAVERSAEAEVWADVDGTAKLVREQVEAELVDRVDDRKIRANENGGEATHKSTVSEARVHSKANKTTRSESSFEAEKEDEPWLAFYADRLMLQISADVLLMYAHTHNFFSLNPYAVLESSPIEVYARELGNDVPRSVVDSDVTFSDGTSGNSNKSGEVSPTSPVRVNEKNQDEGGSGSKPKKTSRKKIEEQCCPEEVVAKVRVRYRGDYVLSQLLQWYNGGMGQKPGLPDMLGTVVLPSIDACWVSKLSEKRRGKTRTVYESKLRPLLVEWMQDPYRRGSPWPKEVAEAFIPKNAPSAGDGDEEDFVRFGSPILDFLVTGDETGIFNLLEELDAHCSVSATADDPGLLTSVDKGRPAQAVCRWVQCENSACLKWRKIPWHVDIDLLPEHFFCKDNKWDSSKNSCDAPEDDWDKNDKLVGSDGKVQVSPIRKDKFTSPSNQLSFHVGARFDVKRTTKGAGEKYSVATVTHIDFSGSIKRIKFHFSKTSSDADEWIPLGSDRIAPLHSKTAQKSVLHSKTAQKSVRNGSKNTAKGETIAGQLQKQQICITAIRHGKDAAFQHLTNRGSDDFVPLTNVKSSGQGDLRCLQQVENHISGVNYGSVLPDSGYDIRTKDKPIHDYKQGPGNRSVTGIASVVTLSKPSDISARAVYPEKF